MESADQASTEGEESSRLRAGWARPIGAATVVVAGGAATVIAILVVAGLVTTHLLAHTVGSWDDRLSRWFVRHRTSTDDTITADFTLLANTMGIVAVAAVAVLIAAVRHHLRLAIALVIALGAELVGFLVSNTIVARPRPQVSHVGSTPSTFSWPSGHVAATLVLYGGIALMVTIVTGRVVPRILAWALPVVLVPCVALSRIYRGEHHPTDTMAGLVLGVAALAIGFAAVRTWSRASAGGHPTSDVADSQTPPVMASVSVPSAEPYPVGAGTGRPA